MLRMITWLATGALLLGGCGPKVGAAGTEHARPALPDYNLSRAQVGIEGFDPVAYFPEGGGTPTAGDPSISTSYEGVTYNFSSQENLERFLASPRHYEPSYGGWCAYAMAKGNKISVDPEAFLIQEDRLLLFYRTSLNDTRDKWAEKPDDMLIDADINWRNWTGECPQTRLSGDGPMSSMPEPEEAAQPEEATQPDEAPEPDEVTEPDEATDEAADESAEGEAQ